MLQVKQLDLTDAQGLRESQTPAVIICDTHGNPIVVVIEHQPGVEVITTRNDPDFVKDLATLGVKDIVTKSIVVPSQPVPSAYQAARRLS